MKWPEKPTCHKAEGGGVFAFDGANAKYNAPRPVDKGPGTHLIHHTRTCEWCGSTHPEDLMKLDLISVEMADWKYGFPHKYYIHAKNPEAGKIVEVGSDSGPVRDDKGEIVRDANGVIQRYEKPIMGQAGDLWGKFYTKHILDEGYDDEAKQAFLKWLNEAPGNPLNWFIRDGQLWYERK